MTRTEPIVDLAASRRHLRLADVEQTVERIAATVFDQIAQAMACGGRIAARLRRLHGEAAQGADRPQSADRHRR